MFHVFVLMGSGVCRREHQQSQARGLNTGSHAAWAGQERPTALLSSLPITISPVPGSTYVDRSETQAVVPLGEWPLALLAGFVAPIRLADRLRRYLPSSLCSLRALQDGTLAVSSSANVSGPGLWVSYLRGKRNQATDELTALLEELVEELYPGAQEEHRRAKAAALALREGRDVETDTVDVPQAASSSRADDFDDELRKELEELRAEREVKKGKGKRPPSLISTSCSMSGAFSILRLIFGVLLCVWSRLCRPSSNGRRLPCVSRFT